MAEGSAIRSNATVSKEHLFNKIEELRSQAQKSTDIGTKIQKNKRLSQIPELLYRIETINTHVHQLQEIHKNLH